MQQNHRQGSMLAVHLGKDEYLAQIQNPLHEVVVACYNSPKSITISGGVDEILRIQSQLKKAKILSRHLQTDGNAYHSPHMSEVGVDYMARIDRSLPTLMEQKFRSPKYSFFSTVTGNQALKQEVAPGYWRQNLISPGRFAQAVSQVLKTSISDAFLEIGPHSVLRGSINEIQKSQGLAESKNYHATLTRGSNGAESLLHTAGDLWANNVPVQLSRVNEREASDGHLAPAIKVIPDLPRYQWQYDKPLITENRLSREWRFRKHARHDILGSQIPGGPKIGATWRNLLRQKDISWLASHCVSFIFRFTFSMLTCRLDCGQSGVPCCRLHPYGC